MPGEINWRRGQFYEFRATTKIHVGVAATDLFEGDVFFFDGQTLILNETKYQLPALKGAWDMGWMVHSNDQVSVYTPQPANLNVGPAVRDREDINVASPMTVQHEEQVVSTRSDGGFQTVPAEGTDQGVVVHNFQGPSSEVVIRTASQAMQASGGVTVPAEQTMMRAGDDIDRLFPESPSSGDHYPPPHVVHSDEPSYAAQARRQHRMAREEKQRELTAQMMMKAQTQNQNQKAPEPREVAPDPVLDEEPEGEFVRTSVGIDWDLAPHWRKRAQTAISRYGKSREILLSIIEVEQPGVKKFIEEYLESEDGGEEESLEVVSDEETEIPLMGDEVETDTELETN